MNNRMAKWTLLAAMTASMGILAVNSNVKADTLNTPAVSSPTQQAINSSRITATDVYAATATTPQAHASAYYNQTVNIPNGYNLSTVRGINNQTSAYQFQNNTAAAGISMNNYTSDPTAAQERVDVNNLTASQASQMNDFALNLVNQVRSQFGEAGFTSSNSTLSTVEGMANQYQNKGESLLNNGWHDQSILNGASENISAFALYDDNIANLGYEHFANVRGSELANFNRIPLIVVNNMDDLQAMVYYGVMGMLFNDASDNFGHAQNFLTNSHGNQMAVYPSVTYTTGTGTTSDGAGNVIGNFSYKVQRVDMHFIWPTASQVPATETQWHQNSNGTWSLLSNGQRQTGWQNVNGTWYYMNNDGIMETGIQSGINGQTYYFNNSGAMQTGWQQVNNSWYYFYGSGNAATGWFQSGAGNWYYFGDNGAALTGMQTINGHHYYFDTTNAWALTGWQKLNGSWYYFDPTNAWADTGWFQSGAGNWYYFGDDGAALTGMQTINGHHYYFAGTNAWALTGWQKLDGNWYYFDPTNAWADTGWFQSGAGNWYYFGDDGAVLTGMQTINGHRYYFDPVNAWALTGWQKLDGSWYYFDPTNAWADTGWQWLGHWFYFDNQGKMVTGNHVLIDNRYSSFDANGYWLGYDQQ